jgi:hypothetical protein
VRDSLNRPILATAGTQRHKYLEDTDEQLRIQLAIVYCGRTFPNGRLFGSARVHNGRFILDGADRYVVFRVKRGPPH